MVLSDHGQSQGETFLDRYGETLEELVRDACDAESMIAVTEGGDDALGYMSAGLTEFARDDTVAGRTVRTVTRGRVADGGGRRSTPTSATTSRTRTAARSPSYR